VAKDSSHWLIGVLPQHRAVARAERIGRGVVMVERKDMSPTVVGILSANPVTCADLEPLLAGEPRPAMFVNIPTRASWTGEAIDNLEAEGIAFGKMYDLYRGLGRDDDLSAYRNPEFYFVERMIDQHRNVALRERLSDRVYRISRHVGPGLVIALSQDYEVTADVVRTAYADHVPFDVLFKTNPYGRISTQGREAADKLGIQVVDAEGLHQILAP
jgi:hypothetical protein